MVFLQGNVKFRILGKIIKHDYFQSQISFFILSLRTVSKYVKSSEMQTRKAHIPALFARHN